MVLTSGNFVSGSKIRFRVKVINPGLPQSSSLYVALMKKYEPAILEYASLPAAFTCVSSAFKPTYPRLFYGPSLDTSSPTYPDLPLFQSIQASNVIVFNSIRVDFMIDTDLPPPSDHYKLVVTIKGSTKTTIPVSYIYDNLPR